MTIGIQQALALKGGQTLFHIKLRNRDGTALRARVNGKVQTWKTRPYDFKVPMKHGLRDSFYLTPSNAGEWLYEDPTVTVEGENDGK